MGARASMVNRTHRVIREQALELREQRQRSRSLWVPLGIFSIVLPLLCYAVWFMMDGYDELASNGIPDASDQLLVLILWSLPVVLAALGMVWFKRSRENVNREAGR